MATFGYALLSVFIVSVVSLAGLFTLSLKEALVKRLVFALVAISVGVLLGDVFIHLLPELFELRPDSLALPLGIFAGFLLFFGLEKFLHWQHCHSDDDTEKHFHQTRSRTLASLVIASDGLHNFIDGVLIAAAYMISVPLGVATTLAVIFHEIPQEIGDFGLLIHSGFSTTKALLYNFLSALLAFAGLLLGWLIGGISDSFIFIMTAITAGGFIYVAGSDIVPELHKTVKPERSLIQFIGIVVGFGLMIGLLAFE